MRVFKYIKIKFLKLLLFFSKRTVDKLYRLPWTNFSWKGPRIFIESWTVLYRIVNFVHYVRLYVISLIGIFFVFVWNKVFYWIFKYLRKLFNIVVFFFVVFLIFIKNIFLYFLKNIKILYKRVKIFFFFLNK